MSCKTKKVMFSNTFGLQKLFDVRQRRGTLWCHKGHWFSSGSSPTLVTTLPRQIFQTCERSNKTMKQNKRESFTGLLEIYRVFQRSWSRRRLHHLCLRNQYQHLIAALLQQECPPSATSCTTSAARSHTRTWRSRSLCAAGHFTMAPTCSSPACSSPAWPCWSSCSPPTPERRFHWVRPVGQTQSDTQGQWLMTAIAQKNEKNKKQNTTASSHLSGIFTLAASIANCQLVYLLSLYANADIKPTNYLLLWGFIHSRMNNSLSPNGEGVITRASKCQFVFYCDYY